MNSHLSSEQFRAVIGAIKVFGKLTDIHVSEATLIEEDESKARPIRELRGEEENL